MSGGGSLSQVVDVSDGAGYVSAVWTLGPQLGRQTVTVSVDGKTATFEATATPAPGAD